MKENLHPTWFPEATVTCMSCGKSWKTGATLATLTTEICSNCHPFYTGEQRIIDTEGRVDISLICINGVTGNMDTKEAAFLAWRQGCKVAVPMHWGLWPDDMETDPPQTLDLNEFTDTYRRLEPNGTVWIPRIGEPLELK